MRGHGGFMMMDWNMFDSYQLDLPRENPGRMAMGAVLSYAERIDLRNMIPNRSFSECSTRYLLKHRNGKELLVYQDGSGPFSVDLLGTAEMHFSVEWLRIGTWEVRDGEILQGGGTRTLSPPWSGRVVAYLIASIR